jgi:isopenicillin-N epimerase
MDYFKNLFTLDPNIIFLNHGSFGACPKPVFETYQAWQRQLEAQPVLFLARKLPDLDRIARQALGAYLSTNADNLVFIPNATHGVNIIARSIIFNAGDEILSTDHEYGACDYTWEYICQKTQAVYRKQAIPLPVNSRHEILEQFWQGVTERTRVIFLSHITSPTALQFPIEEICHRARLANILTVIDGAHAPGQLPLFLDSLQADFYIGNCHKWMLSPKGAGFLYARPEVQTLIEPLIVSWGYHATPETTSGSQYVDLLRWTGTKDPAAELSVPAAIDFMKQHNWPSVQRQCHLLLTQAINEISEMLHLPSVYPKNSELYYQMGIAPLPKTIEPMNLKHRLYNEYHIEVPVIQWNNNLFIRLSIQAYNQPSDIDRLLEALHRLLLN